MGDSLREQLLKAGFTAVRPAKLERKQHAPARSGKAGKEPDLAQAYALRAKVDRVERETAEREARELAQAKRERKQKLQELLNGRTLNRADAGQPRHFDYKGKIRRVYVTAKQMKLVNDGELGVVVQAGHFLLVEREVALKAQQIAPDALALLVDPDATDQDDGVPDDLAW